MFLRDDLFSSAESWKKFKGILREKSTMGPTVQWHVGQNHLQARGIQLDMVYTE